MRQFLRRRYEQLTCDDLFLRVISAFGGLTIGGIGVFMAIAGSTRDSLAWLGWFALLWWPVALLAIVWGALLLSRCVVRARSRLARLAERWLPDLVGFDESILLAIVFLMPAVLLTLLLRAVGINGQQN